MALAMLVTACGPKPGATTGEKETKVQFGPHNTVIVGTTIDDAVTMDPQVSYEFSGIKALHNIYSNLVTFEGTEPKPSLAENWKKSDDNKTWTFTLKKGIKFSSGNEVTAEDVIYSFKRAVSIDKNPAAWLVTDNMGITKENIEQQVRALDSHTVEIKLTKDFAPGAFLAVMAFPTTAIVDSKVVKANEQSGDLGAKYLFDHSAGSGPYILEKWEKDVQMVLAPNPNYNLTKAPAIKRVIFKHVKENTAQLQQLQAGDVDIATSLSAEQLKTVKGSDKYYIHQSPALSLVYLGMDVKNVPAFAKIEVRQAIKYAINYDAIVTHLLQGNGLPTQGVIPKGMYGYLDKTPYKQDFAKAKQLMEKAGYANGFTVEMLMTSSTLAGGVNPTDLASLLKEDLAKIGITVNLRQMTSSELYNIYRGQKSQLVLARWGADYLDPDNFAKPFANFPSKSLAWRLQWEDPNINAKVQKAGTLPNGAERQKLYNELNEQWMAESPFAVLYQPLDSLAVSSKVQNINNNPIWGIEFLKVTKK